MRSRKVGVRPLGGRAQVIVAVMVFALSTSITGAEDAFKPVSKSGLLGAGFSLPLRDFARGNVQYGIDTSSAGFAGYGFSFGGQFRLHFGSSGLGWVFGADLILNTFDVEEFDTAFFNSFPLERDQMSRFESDAWWLNIPVFTGPRFDVPIVDRFKVYGQAMIGPSLRRAPSVRFSGESDNGTPFSGEFLFNATPSLALGLETGFVIGRMSLGSRFCFLGGSKVKSTLPVYSQGKFVSRTGERRVPVSLWQLLAGIDF